MQALGKKPLKVAVLSRCSARETFRDAAAVNATRWELYRRIEGRTPSPRGVIDATSKPSATPSETDIEAKRGRLRRVTGDSTALGLPVEVGTGGRTKYNRSVIRRIFGNDITARELPKTHWLDAACVGVSTPEVLKVEGIRPLVITATGRGSRQM